VTGAGPPVHPKRAWWIPLLGVGSIGMGGLQALAGLGMGFVGLSAGGAAPAGFLLTGAAWFVPGMLLGVSGVAVLGGWPSARRLCVLAVIAAAAGLGLVAWRRQALPPAIADAAQWALEHPEAPPWARKAFDESAAGRGRDLLKSLKDPGVAREAAPFYVGYCSCPILPWYLLVLAAGFSRSIASPKR